MTDPDEYENYEYEPFEESIEEWIGAEEYQE